MIPNALFEFKVEILVRLILNALVIKIVSTCNALDTMVVVILLKITIVDVDIIQIVREIGHVFKINALENLPAIKQKILLIKLTHKLNQEELSRKMTQY